MNKLRKMNFGFSFEPAEDLEDQMISHEEVILHWLEQLLTMETLEELEELEEIVE